MSESTSAPLPDGGRLTYATSGKQGDPALLLLRPLGGSMALWGRFAGALGKQFFVVAFDPRGVGRSSAARVPTTTLNMAQDAIALLDHLALPRAHVFGISLGGMVASSMLIDHAARIDRVVLASTVARGLSLSRSAALRWISAAPALLRPAREAEVVLTKRILSRRFRTRKPEEVAKILERVRAQPASMKTLFLHLAAAATHDARTALRRTRTPTLLLYGDRDPLIPSSARRELASSIARGVVQTVRESGHDLTLEQPIETALRVARFLGDAR